MSSLGRWMKKGGVRLTQYVHATGIPATIVTHWVEKGVLIPRGPRTGAWRSFTGDDIFIGDILWRLHEAGNTGTDLLKRVADHLRANPEALEDDDVLITYDHTIVTATYDEAAALLSWPSSTITTIVRIAP